MEEEIDPPQSYIDAFNLGYQLNKIDPEIASLLDHLNADGQKFSALKAGIKQQRDEIFEDLTPDWLRQTAPPPDKTDSEIDKDAEIDLD